MRSTMPDKVCHLRIAEWCLCKVWRHLEHLNRGKQGSSTVVLKRPILSIHSSFNRASPFFATEPCSMALLLLLHLVSWWQSTKHRNSSQEPTNDCSVPSKWRPRCTARTQPHRPRPSWFPGARFDGPHIQLQTAVKLWQIDLPSPDVSSTGSTAWLNCYQGDALIRQ